MRRIYLDNAATTKVDPEVLQAMLPYFKGKFGNPSSLHWWGQEARSAIEGAREKVAAALGCKAGEIIFTSCASESINLATKGIVEAVTGGDFQKAHIIVSPIEHHAGLDAAKHLEKLGTKVTWLSVDKYGLVDREEIKRAIRPETVLVSVMYVNNEVGTIEPISDIGKLLKDLNAERPTLNPIYFHTDAVQAIQYLDCNVKKLNVDLLSLSGHKFYAPKGIGVLFRREGVPLIRQLDGGEQESKMRAGTENAPYIVGLARATELVSENKEREAKRVSGLRDKLIEGVLKIGGIHLTGHPQKRVPHIASFVIEGVEGEAMLLMLSDEGIAASSGSACTSAILEPSHVLTAMGVPPELAHGSLRLSLGRQTTEEDIGYALKVLPKKVTCLRKMAPKDLKF